MEKMIDQQTINKGAAMTKIVWTLGPASRSVVMLQKLLEAGMNVARFNLSEGSYAYHQETLNNLRTAIRNTGILCAVMLDTKGPEIRSEEEVYPSTLTQKDKEDILQWGIPNEIDIIALSSVRKGSDLDEVREFLGVQLKKIMPGVHAKNIILMSKFGNEEEAAAAAANVDEILEGTDAVMLARGNSGMETIIEKANALGKPIVTVIQILDELTNAVLDCTIDCVMLADDFSYEEEAHPDTVLQRISSLCKELESCIDYKAVHKKRRNALPRPLLPIEGRAAYASWNSKAKAIITVAKAGAKVVAKCRPSVPVISVVQHGVFSSWSMSNVASLGLVTRGVIPLVGAGSGWIEDMIRFGVQFVKKEGICNAGDKVVAVRILNGCAVALHLLVD